jgi:uncharacterized protein YceK
MEGGFMKRLLVCLMVVAFLMVGCAASLSTLRPEQDLQKNISILMGQVNKCKADEEGWKILEIPDKNFENNHIKFIVYSHAMRSSWGVGLTDGDQIITLGYDSKQDLWIYSAWFGSMPVTKEQADELLKEWIALVCKSGDLSRAKQFQPPKESGTEI